MNFWRNYAYTTMRYLSNTSQYFYIFIAQPWPTKAPQRTIVCFYFSSIVWFEMKKKKIALAYAHTYGNAYKQKSII